MDHLLKAIGMEAVPWSYKTECCGASLTLTRSDVVRRLSGRLFAAAQDAGAECIVTDCPMCQSNLDTLESQIEAELGRRFGLPVFYVTELMALSFGLDAQKWWKKHFVDPAPLLAEKNLFGPAGRTSGQ
jgi:heterodisulfide reductase subunit B